MNLAGRIYRLDDIEIDFAQACVRRNGREQHLRHQAFDVLIYLLERHHRLVTKDELIETVWRDTSVTDNALVQCIAEIRRALGDNPHHPRFIKTFSKFGYRFIASVEEESFTSPPQTVEHSSLVPEESVAVVSAAIAPEGIVGVRAEPAESPRTPSPGIQPDSAHDSVPPRQDNEHEQAAPRWRWGRSTLAIAFLLVAVMAFGIVAGFHYWPRVHGAEMTLPQLPGKRALAVMYFDNRSDRTDLNWLREGLADMLINDLSRSDKLTVLSRQQLYLLLERVGHGGTQQIRLDEALDIARRTRADVVMLGSFSAFGDQIRIDAQLYDVGKGQFIAADQLVVNHPGEILTQIDSLALKLAGHLGTRIGQSTNTTLAEAMTDNLEAYRYYSLGVEKAQAFQNAQAISLLRKAVELDPKFAMAYARIGYAYAVTDFASDEGKPYLEKALQLSDRLSSKDNIYVSAWYAVAKSDYPEAIRIFRRIVAQYPMETEAYWRLARLLQGEDQAEEGIRVLKQGLAVDPEAKELYNTLGVNYLSLRRYPEAISAHERYVELAPNEPNAHDSLGMSLQQSGRYDEAIAEYNRALNLEPEFEPAIIHLGDVYFQQGRYREAIRQYQRYIHVTHSDSARSVGYGNIAQVYLRKGDLRRAEEAAANEMRYGKGAAWTSLLIALEKHDHARVQNLKDMLLQRSSFGERGARNNVRMLKYYLGYAALKSGEPAKAIADFKEALQHLPPSSGIDLFEDCLANAYLETGQVDDAIREYERILRTSPNYPLVQYHLAQAYERKGDHEKARIARQHFLTSWGQADSDLPEIKQARKIV